MNYNNSLQYTCTCIFNMNNDIMIKQKERYLQQHC